MVTGCSTYFPFGYLYPLHNYFLNVAVQNSIAGLRERSINPCPQGAYKKDDRLVFGAKVDDELMLASDG